MAKKIPAFSYTGAYRTQSDENYWYIFLLTSGTLTFQYAKNAIDVGCVGGGGATTYHQQSANTAGGCGGGGGYISTGTAAVAAGQGYAVTIGEGGAVPGVWLPAGDGGTTSALGVSAAGGKGARDIGWLEPGTPGAGTGTGGTGGVQNKNAPTAGGDGQMLFGFGPYGGGGGGGGTAPAVAGGSGGLGGGGAGGFGGNYGTDGKAGEAGAANTGGGAGGPGGGYVDEDSRYNSKGGMGAAGGSGIVILRGTQDDLIPVVIDGTQLSELYFNGVKVTSLVFGGVKLFMERLGRRRRRCFA